MTDQLETKLRQHLVDVAEQAPAAQGLAAGAMSRVRARRRSRLLVGASSLVVIALVGGLVWLRGPATAASPLPSTATPAGQQWVSYHGIELLVPSSFAVGPHWCGLPTTNSVIPDTGQASSCPPSGESVRPAALTYVYLSPADTPVGTCCDTAAPTAVHTDVHAVTITSGTDSRLGRVTVLGIADENVQITVASDDSGLAKRLLATIRVSATDRLGCGAQVRTFRPDSTLSAEGLLEQQPVSGVVCEYGAQESRTDAVESLPRWLVGSRALSSSELRQVGIAMEPASISASSSNPIFGTPFVWYQLTMADGSSRTIAATLDTDPVTVSDGPHIVNVERAHYPESFPYTAFVG